MRPRTAKHYAKSYEYKIFPGGRFFTRRLATRTYSGRARYTYHVSTLTIAASNGTKIPSG